MEEERQKLKPEDVSFVTRVADDSGVLKRVIFKGKLEISAVVCTLDHVQSFGMWYSLLVGKLPALDVALLARDLPQYLWLPWGRVLEVMRLRLDNISVDDLNLVNVEILGFIPHLHTAEEVRKLLLEDPFHLLDILNDDRVPLSGGKVVLGSLWVYYGVYRWVSVQQGKQPLWNGTVNKDSCLPEPSPFTAKALERNFGDASLRPAIPLRHPGLRASAHVHTWLLELQLLAFHRTTPIICLPRIRQPMTSGTYLRRWLRLPMNCQRSQW